MRFSCIHSRADIISGFPQKQDSKESAENTDESICGVEDVEGVTNGDCRYW
jgi:hypothetical protein